MSDFFSGLAQGLSGGLNSAASAHHEDRELSQQADAYFPYVQDKLSDETRQRWAQMSGKEKLAKIKAWQFAQEQDLLKKHQALEDKKNDYFFRNSNVEYNLNQEKLRKQLNPPPVPQLGATVNTGRGPGVVTNAPGQGSIQLPPNPPAGGVAIDTATGLPKVSVSSNVFFDPQGGAHLLTDAQRKAQMDAEATRNEAAAGTNIPGMADLNKQLVEQQGRLAEGRSGRYTLFPGVTVGTPRTDVIKGLETRKAALMKLYGTQAPPAPTPGATAAPAATPPAAGNAGKTHVVSPDGKTTGWIPAQQLDTYIKAGYKQISDAGPDAAAGQDVMAGMEQFMA